MPACPVCDTDNPVTAVECESCGKALRRGSEVPGFAPALVGLEHTLQDAAEVQVDRLPELELTALASRSLRAPLERLEVERTPFEPDPAAPVAWSAGPLELDTGREPEDGARTPAPIDAGECPWCGAASGDAVCGSCGRHRARHFAPPIPPPDGAAPGGEHVLCPACFARVADAIRCAECGVPLPIREL